MNIEQEIMNDGLFKLFNSYFVIQCSIFTNPENITFDKFII